jgi:alanine dehydrogenase
MIVGIPKEIKNNEFRVAMTPEGVAELVRNGHKVVVETNAGDGSGFTDDDYQKAGATVLADAKSLFSTATMIVKVKEPQATERALLTRDHTLFTYLHLAPDPAQTADLIKSEATCIAYETVTDDHGRLPLLAPMSEVAGRMSIQAGAFALERSKGGRGILLAGVPGVSPAKVVILGGGVVGKNAAQMAVGMGADVTVLDRSIEVLRTLDSEFNGRVKTIYATAHAIEAQVLAADLVIGSVLIPGAAAPKLVSAEMVKRMKSGAAVVDVAIDQGGCFATARPTTHAEPTYIVDDVVHYCVANMPGAVARTSTYALSNATLPYIVKLANLGTVEALKTDKHLLNGLNIRHGKVTCGSVASALGYKYIPPQQTL